jgi:hypothetical protein
MIRRGILVPTLMLTAALSAAGPARSQPATEMVQRIYVHGVPSESARALGPAAVPELVALLGDPELDEFRMNIVATLGYIGDPAAIDPLMEFVRGLNGEISVHTFRAVLTTFQALGHLSQAGDARALQLLIDGSDEAHWASAGLSFSYRVYRDERLGEVLGRMSVQGLGISGRPEAYRALRDLASGDLREDWYDNVGEAMELNGRVAVEGARAVFSEVGE